MTTPLKAPAGEAPAHMDDTSAPSTARPQTAAGSAPAGASPTGGEDPRSEAPPLAASQASDTAKRPRRTIAVNGTVANAVLLVGVLVAFLGVMGTAVGVPLYLMDGNIRELGNAIRDDIKQLEDRMDAKFAARDAQFAALEDKMDTKFAEFDARFAEMDTKFAEFDAKLAALEDKMDTKFAEFDAKLAALEDKMDTKFAEFDAKLAAHGARLVALENGQAEINSKLTGLIAHLNATEAVEGALAGRLK